MIEFSAATFFWAGAALEKLKDDCLLRPNLVPNSMPVRIGSWYEPLDEATIRKTTDRLKPIHGACSKIGLTISAETAHELMDTLDPTRVLHLQCNYQWLRDKLTHLQDLISKEMRSKLFFYVTPEKLRFFPTDDIPNIFGDDVVTAFPSADFDIREAGICLATARATASVFHLMRVLEIGLTALGSVFGVSLAHTNWAPALKEIESRIREMHEDANWRTRPDRKEQQEFYAQVASHFGILKDAWRNYTVHARGKYTEEEAMLIFDNVRVFMKVLATRLHE